MSYYVAHRAVRKANGSAADWWCEHCDSRAAEWAYDGKDPDEQIGVHVSGKNPLRYSTKPEHYFPLCRVCHAEFDRPRRSECGTCGGPLSRGTRGWDRCQRCAYEKRVIRGEIKRPGIGYAQDRAHCPHGHVYSEENTYLARRQDGSIKQRMCRECMRQRNRAYRAAKAGDAQ